MWNVRACIHGGALITLAACSGSAAPAEEAEATEAGSPEVHTPDSHDAAMPESGGASAPRMAAAPAQSSAGAGASGTGGQSSAGSPAAAKPATTEPATTAPAAGSGGSLGGQSTAPMEKFSFFITSLRGMIELSKNDQGFGGDLRFGKASGLEGADAICTTLAEQSMPGAAAKGWHAFLSAAKGGDNDGPIHAKDRIGMGPWYDRLGRLVAANVADLLHERPVGADPAIADDLPNERGEPNHSDTVEGMEDNHDVVTGTNKEGLWDGNMTCQDWTSTETPPDAQPGEMTEDDPLGLFTVHGPGLGHSWPGGRSGGNWIAAHQARGCGAVVALVQTGPGTGTGIGSAGGYGAIYCFALKP